MSEWIGWSGGECPLPRDARVHVVLSNGRVADWDLCGMSPKLFDWSDKGRPFVARYKILWEPQRDPNAHESVRKQPEWDGEGLPPVGAVVEYSCNDNLEEIPGEWGEGELWIKGDLLEVLAIRSSSGSDVLVLWCARTETSLQRTPNLVRPIRSDEEKAVGAAMQDIGAEVGDHASIKGVIERMIAAGYRKTEEV